VELKKFLRKQTPNRIREIVEATLSVGLIMAAAISPKFELPLYNQEHASKKHISAAGYSNMTFYI